MSPLVVPRSQAIFDENEREYKSDEQKVKDWLIKYADMLGPPDPREYDDLFAPRGRNGEPSWTALSAYVRDNATGSCPGAIELRYMENMFESITFARAVNLCLAGVNADQGHMGWLTVLQGIQDDLHVLLRRHDPPPVQTRKTKQRQRSAPTIQMEEEVQSLRVVEMAKQLRRCLEGGPNATEEERIQPEGESVAEGKPLKQGNVEEGSDTNQSEEARANELMMQSLDSTLLEMAEEARRHSRKIDIVAGATAAALVTLMLMWWNLLLLINNQSS